MPISFKTGAVLRWASRLGLALRQALWVLLASLILSVGVNETAQAADQALVRAADIELSGDATRLNLLLSEGVTAEVFTLSDPYRVVIDLPDTGFSLPEGTGARPAGLIKGFRYGLFAPGKGRIVIDTAAPVVVSSAEMVPAAGSAIAFKIELRQTDKAAFGKGTGAHFAKRKPGEVDSGAPPAARRSTSRAADAKPLVVIDPGHGGIDPGAVAPGDLYEKQIVLEVSKRVVRKLRETGRYRVDATRTSDVFVSLDDRIAFAETRQADLFISLHADSLGDQRAARLVSGATVYTLSQRASDETARKMAEKENSSDILAGLIDVDRAAPEAVTTILFDLMARESSVFALDFAKLLAGQLKAKVPVAKKARRSAAFKVLKQTQTPAVLLELGYMSNPRDRKMMQTRGWQEKVASAVVKSVEVYFRKRLARSK